jgi:hypothetical protein
MSLKEDAMKYRLGAAASLLLVFSGTAMADNVFNCQDVGLTSPEPVGDQNGHVLIIDNFSCRVEDGPMAGGVMTGTVAWDLTKGKGTLLSGTGVIRKPGSLVIYKDLDGALNLTINEKGEVTGGGASGTATWVFATGDAAPLKGKVMNWTSKGTGPATFVVQEKTD